MFLWKRKNWLANPEIPSSLYSSAYVLETAERELLAGMSPHDMEFLASRAMEDEIRASFGIEGISMDCGEIRRAIAKDNQRKGKEARAISAVLHMMHGGPVSHELLCQCHALLSPVPDKAWGKYRDHPESVYDENGESVYDAPNPPQMLRFMEAFVNWWREERPKLPLPLGSALAHLFFETIHPFHDGNGRIGRMLADKAWEKNGAFLRIFSVSKVIVQDRNRYYTALNAVETQGKITDWLSYMLEMQETALQEAQERAHRLKDIGEWLANTDFQPDRNDLEIIFEMGLSGRRRWTEFDATRYMEDDEIAEKAWTKLTEAGIIRDGELDLDAPRPAAGLGPK